jgi:hypothetical protein
MFLDSLTSSLGDEAATILGVLPRQHNDRLGRTCLPSRYSGRTRQQTSDQLGRGTTTATAWTCILSGRTTGEHSGTNDEPAYCGTLDVIYLMPGGKVARIVDWKSSSPPIRGRHHPRQALQLCCCSCTCRKWQEIEFGLRFVRYANIVKTHKYFRSDVPQMMEDVRRIRNRQKEIHAKVEEGGELRVHGGAHCCYCPCALDPVGVPCPNGALNPMLKSPGEMLNWVLSTEVQMRMVKDALKQHVDGTGQNVYSQDANGKVYTFGPVSREKVTYPLFEGNIEEGFNMPIVDALLNWVTTNPKDLIPRKGSKPWFDNLQHRGD